jgi:threonine/homoserine/homoserine lactone efflux protein
VSPICLWLAWQAARAGGALSVAPDRARDPAWRIAWRGTVLNLLNPKLSIFFLALLPPFLSGNPASATAEMIGLGAVFMAMTFGVFVLYGAFAAAARDLLLGNAAVMRWLGRAFAAVFVALAARLAVERPA